MNELEDPEYDTICTQCNQKIINYLKKLCRRKFLLSAQVNKPQSIQKSKINKLSKVKLYIVKLFKTKSKLPKNKLIDNKTSGSFILDEFIKETQLNSKYCDDFIEWVPHSNLENIQYLTNGGNSKIYFGTWNLLLNTSLASNQLSSKVTLKVINDSDNINDHILNELKIHHKCRNPRVIPFYGIAKAPVGKEYAMVIRYAENGDLRNYIRKVFPKLTWTYRANILIELSKALTSIHQMNLVHKDFHCKNILVDKDDRIFISDFGLCQPIDSEIASNSIQGVLPYIAPEVLRCKPYTKQSEVYSLSMIMWELTSDEPPFSNKHHDAGLALEVLDELKPLRPEIVKGTPEFYANIMEQCWSSDPLKRPDASLLPKLFEEMIGLCKAVDSIIFSTFTRYSSLSESNFVTGSSVNTGYDIRANDNLNMASTYYPKEENTVMINNNNSVDIELSSQPNSVTSIIQPGTMFIL
ncbi:Tpk2p [Rhizophagus irregularis DAOM 197198w]|uniref:Tpk2p n=1 Tax=Rhizophagus irregularis (strain DAOM 197198w) TaxID=1432141 RepID=A0A015LI56_RHIIW|nr:Tpk2p [Rhizophagus irregularis DAOM 197198w]